MARSSRKHAAQHKQHGRVKRPVTAKQAPRASAVSHGARQPSRTRVAPIADVRVVVAEDIWAEASLDFDPYDDLDDLLEEDE